ncbi:hypothetical protein [uncultured Umboniibacter sp.]|uniref:hypothetical protein n=1 Tax=uncultured Umboniibacter sp. TaxID=1798917 RepID=UPI00262389C6|nr:hypothetical protein [uncultured Umboniibacter sp.]
MSDAEINAFLASTPKGSEYYFTGDKSLQHREDGSVLYNDRGNAYHLFSAMSDFVMFFFEGKRVNHQVSLRVGERGDSGIEWFGRPYNENELDPEEDGDSVYTRFVDSDH